MNTIRCNPLKWNICIDATYCVFCFIGKSTYIRKTSLFIAASKKEQAKACGRARFYRRAARVFYVLRGL